MLPGFCTDKVNCTEWLKEPEVPLKVTVVDEEGALSAAVNVIVCAVPGVSVMDDGLMVTPLGKLETAMATVEVNPLLPVAVNEIERVPPSFTFPLSEEIVSEKSGFGGGGGGGGLTEPPPPPPPQALKKIVRRTERTKRKRKRARKK